MIWLGAGYVAVGVWLYAFSSIALLDSILVDVVVTVVLIILAVIAYAATGGYEDSS
jgi:hypothetical protein